MHQGRTGIHDTSRVESIDVERKKRWFLKDPARPDSFIVKPALSQLISFKRLNLLETWPMKGKFDVIFCRNVVIYFNKGTQRTLFNRYANILADGGYLFIGHSETLHRVSDRFESLGKTVYRKSTDGVTQSLVLLHGEA
ncbi:MAG: chemotaxis protein methyltransferase CheR [Gammaproteobacteria bacterium]|nr:MAG: chemotaxis protein methyltransferase CheR [Pseudomonadota bacterium]PIE38106.1 MAG: chemotaxis protein methyltransferase CheR [Gammaproteobacteria bacterium]